MGDEAVWVEKTGRTVDGAARAVRAWADSRHCDFRGGAPLAALLKSVLDHHLHAVRGPAPDLSARSLGILLKGLSNEFPTRFAKCPGRRVGWSCAPALSRQPRPAVSSRDTSRDPGCASGVLSDTLRRRPVPAPCAAASWWPRCGAAAGRV
mmetsp:Transcript_5301/g.19218  ORF Transcript_5301/g.19218 Transcript_5301/m.19218 type:complete len:151 (-) Transcript_5301:693-1145(-)